MNHAKSSKSVWFLGVLCLLLVALIAVIIVGVSQNQSSLFASSSFKKAMTKLFDKNASQITQADLDSIEVAIIDDTNASLVFGTNELYKIIEENAQLEEGEEAKSYDDHMITVELSTPITSFDDYKLFKNLKYLSVSGCSTFTDLSQLENFKDLVYLYLDNTSIDSLESVAAFTQLKGLHFSKTKVTDLSPLKNLPDLQSVSMDSLQISDISALADLKLTSLSAAENGISDLTPLKNMTMLETLELSNNKISDISPLAGLDALTYLSVEKNAELKDLSALEGTTKITNFMAGNCAIEDISPLKGNEKMSYLYLGVNKIRDISPLEKMHKLYYLDLSKNLVTDGTPLKDKTALGYLVLTDNVLEDWTVLDGLANTQIVGKPSTTKDESAESSKDAATSSKAPASSAAATSSKAPASSAAASSSKAA